MSTRRKGVQSAVSRGRAAPTKAATSAKAATKPRTARTGGRGKGKALRYKLFVFDLDETLWTVSGGLCNLIEAPFRVETPDRLVGRNGLWVELFPDVRRLFQYLKERGAYISLASRNDAAPTMSLLDFLGLAPYLDHPQLCWKPKEESIKRIIKIIQKSDKVAIKPEEVLFVDDWPENVNAVRQWGATALLFGQDIHSFEDLIEILE